MRLHLLVLAQLAINMHSEKMLTAYIKKEFMLTNLFFSR